jgi:hypothetical protein
MTSSFPTNQSDHPVGGRTRLRPGMSTRHPVARRVNYGSGHSASLPVPTIHASVRPARPARQEQDPSGPESTW